MVVLTVVVAVEAAGALVSRRTVHTEIHTAAKTVRTVGVAVARVAFNAAGAKVIKTPAGCVAIEAARALIPRRAVYADIHTATKIVRTVGVAVAGIALSAILDWVNSAGIGSASIDSATIDSATIDSAA